MYRNPDQNQRRPGFACRTAPASSETIGDAYLRTIDRAERFTQDLRKEFNHQPERFAEFTHHYLGELAKNPAVAAFRAELKRRKVTLLYGAHDRANNHALVLAEFLRKGEKSTPAKKPARTSSKPAARKRPAAPARKKATRKKRG